MIMLLVYLSLPVIGFALFIYDLITVRRNNNKNYEN